MMTKARLTVAGCAFLLPLLVAVPANAQSKDAGGPDPTSVAKLWTDGDPGQRLHIRGRVLGADGKPLAGAVVMVRQADGAGSYHPDRYRATLRTDTDGIYRLATALPGQYSSNKHIHVVVSHDKHRPVYTEMLFKGDPTLDDQTELEDAIPLESALVEGETVLFGRFETVMQPMDGG